MVVFVLPVISFLEAELGLFGFVLFLVFVRRLYKLLKSEWRDNPEQQSPKTLNLTVKTTKTRIEKTFSLSISPRLLTVPSIMPNAEKIEFTGSVECHTCGTAIPVMSIDTRIIARDTCPKCGNDVLIEGEKPQS